MERGLVLLRAPVPGRACRSGGKALLRRTVGALEPGLPLGNELQICGQLALEPQGRSGDLLDVPLDARRGHGIEFCDGAGRRLAGHESLEVGAGEMTLFRRPVAPRRPLHQFGAGGVQDDLEPLLRRHHGVR